jgi:choline dehydrogenase
MGRQLLRIPIHGFIKTNTVHHRLPIVVVKTSSMSESPDLIMFCLSGMFTGFFPGFSRVVPTPNTWTWDVLKIRPRQAGGTVELRSSNPQDIPEINFRFFEDGQDNNDLKAMSEGVSLARDINAGVSAPDGPFQELIPGPDINTDKEIEEEVLDQAFSHHASCTCSIGADDDAMACLDSKFMVRGVTGLRVVDASSLPRVIGAFPTLALCLISEKATDVILQDAGKFGDDDKLLSGV